MNCLPTRFLILMPLAVLASLFSVRGAVLDNFDEYNNSTDIQAQQGTDGVWSRSGSAVADGLFSSGTGESGGRSAEAVATYSTSGSESVYRAKLTMTSAYDLSSSGSCTIDLDIVVSSTILSHLEVACVIGDTSAAEYETPFISLATDSTFTTFNFLFASGAGDTNVGSAGDSLNTILTRATFIQFVFQDTQDSGTQDIYFTNLVDQAAVPEPSSMAMSLVGGAAALVLLGRRRKRTLPPG